MARIALLGATAHIAKGLAASLAKRGHELLLYARRPAAAAHFTATQGIQAPLHSLDAFGTERCDMVINAIGAGDPGRIAGLGADVFRVTERWDNAVLDHLANSPDTLYLFLSSGAVYGDGFSQAVGEDSRFTVSVNALDGQNFYGLAKLHAEAKHRALQRFNIVDVRVFAYFSRFIDQSGRSFAAELAYAVANGTEFQTDATDMIRDYAGPEDIATLAERALASRPFNGPVDLYSRAPVGKFALIDRMVSDFNVQVRILPSIATISATGAKACYQSMWRRASDLGWEPRATALDTVTEEMTALISRGTQRVL
ncbi:NAD-dependent epimerase/dehydratase family protein [Azospirillum sp.]|uniref:NAD-dependent epimerase/dehydratase family protein n=1 Tax=Azospirillum sp. TaxID=34012 RepID=UPI002625BA8A|nr:NAD-dependent epimerase/dehydratase family protein [Azospirillum sp.]